MPEELLDNGHQALSSKDFFQSIVNLSETSEKPDYIRALIAAIQIAPETAIHITNDMHSGDKSMWEIYSVLDQIQMRYEPDWLQSEIEQNIENNSDQNLSIVDLTVHIKPVSIQGILATRGFPPILVHDGYTMAHGVNNRE